MESKGKSRRLNYHGFVVLTVASALVLMLAGKAIAQVPDCVPGEYCGDRDDIVNERVKKAPFDKIVQLRVNNEIIATGTIVSGSCILTCFHLFNTGEKIKQIEVVFKDTVMVLKKGDFTITEHEKRLKDDLNGNRVYYDIALLHLKKGKAFPVDNKFCRITDFFSLRPALSGEVHVSGYPCDLKSTNVDSTNKIFYKLSDKHVPVEQIKIEPDKKMLAYYVMCICAGDSGGPMWIQSGNEYYLLGITRGFALADAGFAYPWGNMSILIDKEKADWINARIGK